MFIQVDFLWRMDNCKYHLIILIENDINGWSTQAYVSDTRLSFVNTGLVVMILTTHDGSSCLGVASSLYHLK